MIEYEYSKDFDQGMRIGISGILHLRKTPQGGIEILYYGQLGKQIDAIPMVLCFAPDSAGQLAHDLHSAVESGAIVLERSEHGNGLQ